MGTPQAIDFDAVLDGYTHDEYLQMATGERHPLPPANFTRHVYELKALIRRQQAVAAQLEYMSARRAYLEALLKLDTGTEVQ